MLRDGRAGTTARGCGGVTAQPRTLSLPGLIRQSINLRKKLLAKKMDARVKPAHDYSGSRGRPEQWARFANRKRSILPTLNLPVAGGKLAAYTMQPPREFPAAKPPFNRIA